MRATFKLINSYFWKTVYGPILAFVFPIMLLGILGNIMRIEYVYPGIIALNILFLGVLALPLAIMELKGSLLFKYIGSSPVNPLKFSFVIISYYIIISLIAGAFTLTATIIIFYEDVFPPDPDKDFKDGILGGLTTIEGLGSFSFGSFFHLLLVISSGLAVATFSKTPQQALTFAIIIIIPTMFLSGMIITVDIIAKSQTMQWISRFIPFRYSTGNLIVATTPLNQLGDLFTKLSIIEKEVIFGIGGTEDDFGIINDLDSKHHGSIKINLEKIDEEILKKWNWVSSDPTKPKNIYLNSSKDIQNFIVKYQNEDSKISVETIFDTTMKSNKTGGDFFLFKAILINPDALNNSNNNIFKLDQEWSVRKILSVYDIKKFVQDYLSGGKTGTPKIERFTTIAGKISQGRLEFVDMFIKQSTKLYSVPEKSLNIFIPLICTFLLGLYTNKKFTWTNR